MSSAIRHVLIIFVNQWLYSVDHPGFSFELCKGGSVVDFQVSQMVKWRNSTGVKVSLKPLREISRQISPELRECSDKAHAKNTQSLIKVKTKTAFYACTWLDYWSYQRFPLFTKLCRKFPSLAKWSLFAFNKSTLMHLRVCHRQKGAKLSALLTFPSANKYSIMSRGLLKAYPLDQGSWSLVLKAIQHSVLDVEAQSACKEGVSCLFPRVQL